MVFEVQRIFAVDHLLLWFAISNLAFWAVLNNSDQGMLGHKSFLHAPSVQLFNSRTIYFSVRTYLSFTADIHWSLDCLVSNLADAVVSFAVC